MDITVLITARERETILKALRERMDGLDQYKTWIDDHPSLPVRSTAITNLKHERQEAAELTLKLMETTK
jgi:hypothetical protein